MARSGVLKGLEVTIVEINKALELKPELISQDPRREGWLTVVESSNWES